MKPDPAAAAAAELRELIREAHGATKDLARVLREVRQVITGGAAQAAQAAQAASDEELRRYSRHLQKEMNRHAADLNAVVSRAQTHIIEALMISHLEADPDHPGRMRFMFKGRPFDSGPLPDGPETDLPSAG
jgi:hypothetical protein